MCTVVDENVLIHWMSFVFFFWHVTKPTSDHDSRHHRHQPTKQPANNSQIFTNKKTNWYSLFGDIAKYL